MASYTTMTFLTEIELWGAISGFDFQESKQLVEIICSKDNPKQAWVYTCFSAIHPFISQIQSD